MTSGRRDIAARRVLVALDVPGRAQATEIVDRLAPLGVGFKVGLELFCAEGPGVLAWLRPRTAGPLLLDAKLHDIPRTVGRAARRVAAFGVDLLTVHATGGGRMMRAAADGLRQGADAAGTAVPGILAVTVLTHLDAAELRCEAGLSDPSAAAAALRLTALAARSGASGAVCAGPEVAAVRSAHPDPAFLLLVPGVRPAGPMAGDDQRRVATPGQALLDGASLLVAGRAVTESQDPEAACLRFIASIVDAAGGESR